MNNYKTKYVIYTEYEAETDEEADKIDTKNLNAIIQNGEFFVKKFKFKRRVQDMLSVTPQEPIFDNIEAEIEELRHIYPMGTDYQLAITRCLAVIDKYKAEGEE